MKKEIVSSVEFAPNALFHILVTAGIWEGPPSPYILRHGHTLPPRAREALQAQRERIAWGNGRTGDLSHPLFFNPCAIRVETPEDLRCYLMGLAQADAPSGVASLAPHFLSGLEDYASRVWPKEKPRLESVAARLDDSWRRTDLIAAWEEELGKSFPGDRFEIVLTSANDRAPSANDLTRTRYNFFYEPENEKGLQEFVSHEVGTNLLREALEDLLRDETLAEALTSQGAQIHNLPWQAFESLAEFHNGRVLRRPPRIWEGEMFGGGRLQFPFFFAFYASHEADGIANLMRSAIEALLASGRRTLP